ncbi:hypothetical protein [Afifella pfennigii]|nr:hypothetical protein [Afifella pfennigii]
MSNLEFIFLFSILPVGAVVIAVFFYFLSRRQDRRRDPRHPA